MFQSPIQIHSEIGKLKTVLLHRPGTELENLMPEYLSRQLFEDIPYLVHAREEHDCFAKTLRGCGVEVLYVLDLAAEAVQNAAVRREMVRQYLKEAGPNVHGMEKQAEAFLLSFPPKEILSLMVSGVRKQQVEGRARKHLVDYIDDDYPFLVDPMPNMYFTRDPFFNVADGVCISSMANLVRQRETLFGDFIFRYHPVFRNAPRYHERTESFSIEGGDVLVLSRDTVAIGVSQRTSPQAVELLAERLISEETQVRRVLAIDIPKLRAYMHLDTVMTMVDRDKFTVHPAAAAALRCFLLEKRGDRLVISEQQGTLEDTLARVLGLDRVTLIACGGGSVIDAAREQWNDGANTFAVAPGEVVTFSRNHVTNRILRDYGVTVHEIPSAELSRGRGGPRCMSMPFYREEI